MILSISRRCDIPRFRFDWFLDCLKAGFVNTVNPFNAAQTRHVSLKPEDVDFIVFWTRDPLSILNACKELEPYPFYVMVTLTAYPKILEPNMPQKENIIKTMKALKETWGQRIIWRYDPVFLSSLTDAEFHRSNFMDLSSRLSGITDRVIISIYDEYTGAKRRLTALGKKGELQILPHYSENRQLLPQIKNLVSEFAQIAKNAGMEMQYCAETELEDSGVKPGACIDGELIQKIIGEKQAYPGCAAAGLVDKNQRSKCRCFPSIDIGSYSSCPAACVYCYARR